MLPFLVDLRIRNIGATRQHQYPS